MKEKAKECVLCGEEFYGWGNNPAPLKNGGQCCNECNSLRVIPARLRLHFAKTKKSK